MMGTGSVAGRVELSDAGGSYAPIAKVLRNEAGVSLNFGSKAVTLLDHRGTQAVAAFGFGCIGIAIVIDAIGDPSPFTLWSETWFWALLACCFGGVLLCVFPAIESIESTAVHRFTIEENGHPVGIAEVSHDASNRLAVIALGLLPEARNRMVGTYACRRMLRYCFDQLHVDRVESTALSTNPASLSMHDGMIKEGV